MGGELRAGKPEVERRGAASGRSVPPGRAGGGRRPVRGGGPQARPRRRRPGGGVTAAALRPSRVRSRSVASRPASSPSKARKTRGQPRRAEATRSTPWVARAAQHGMPHPVRASQSNSPSATTAQSGAGPRRPRPRTGLGPGRAWKRGVRSGSTARPASQRTRPPVTSGTTTIPANRSAPRSMNSPESLMRFSEKIFWLQPLSAWRQRA